MTQLLISSIGSYPRIGEDKDQQRHRRGSNNFEKKEISAHAFRDVEQSVVQEILAEQIEAGLDEVTDGLIQWQDPISHFCKNIAGIRLDGLTRYFDNNFYYRRPVIFSKPRLKAPVLTTEFEWAQKVSPRPVRAVITGPFTLACHTASTLKSYQSLQKRVDFFTDIISAEISGLLKKGAKLIQVDEPSLTQFPDQFPLVRKSVEKWTKKSGGATLFLAVYFGPSVSLLDSLTKLPVHGLQIDATHDEPDLFRKLSILISAKQIGLGVINAKSTVADDIDTIAEKLKPLIQKHSSTPFRITPSAGLEFLPRNNALNKLNSLNQLKQNLLRALAITPTHV